MGEVLKTLESTKESGGMSGTADICSSKSRHFSAPLPPGKLLIRGKTTEEDGMHDETFHASGRKDNNSAFLNACHFM